MSKLEGEDKSLNKGFWTPDGRQNNVMCLPGIYLHGMVFSLYLLSFHFCSISRYSCYCCWLVIIHYPKIVYFSWIGKEQSSMLIRYHCSLVISPDRGKNVIYFLHAWSDYFLNPLKKNLLVSSSLIWSFIYQNQIFTSGLSHFLNYFIFRQMQRVFGKSSGK